MKKVNSDFLNLLFLYLLFYNEKFIPLATTSFMFSISSSISFGVTIKLYSLGINASLITPYLSSSFNLFKYSLELPSFCNFSINISILSAAIVAASTTVEIRSCNSRSVYVLVTLKLFYPKIFFISFKSCCLFSEE